MINYFVYIPLASNLGFNLINPSLGTGVTRVEDRRYFCSVSGWNGGPVGIATNRWTQLRIFAYGWLGRGWGGGGGAKPSSQLGPFFLKGAPRRVTGHFIAGRGLIKPTRLYRVFPYFYRLIAHFPNSTYSRNFSFRENIDHGNFFIYLFTLLALELKTKQKIIVELFSGRHITYTYPA